MLIQKNILYSKEVSLQILHLKQILNCYSCSHKEINMTLSFIFDVGNFFLTCTIQLLTGVQSEGPANVCANFVWAYDAVTTFPSCSRQGGCREIMNYALISTRVLTFQITGPRDVTHRAWWGWKIWFKNVLVDIRHFSMAKGITSITCKCKALERML